MTPTSASSNKGHLSSVPTLSHLTSESPSHPSRDGDKSTTPSSNKEHLSSVPTLSHSTSESPSHNGDTSIRISIRIYGGTGAAVILLVTIVMMIVAVVACVLQQRRSNSKKEVDNDKTNEYSQVYQGTGQYMLYRGREPGGGGGGGGA